MTEFTIRLIQVRRPNDAMAEHERQCVARRVLPHAAELRVANAYTDEANVAWLDGVDYVIIGGSGDFSVHHPRSQVWVTPLRHLLDALIAKKLPGMGICFGHQLLGYHLGSPVNTDGAHAELGTVSLFKTEAGAADPLFSTLPARFVVHTGHSDNVSEPHDDLELLASSPRCRRQAFRLRGTSFYTTQFHPDLTGGEAQQRYVAYQVSLTQTMSNSRGVPSQRFALAAGDTERLISSHIGLVATARG